VPVPILALGDRDPQFLTHREVGVSETGRLPALLRGFLGAARERFAPV